MPTAATIARRTAQRKRANQIKKQKELKRKTAGPAFIEKIIITANKANRRGRKDNVDVANGTVQLQYWESLLQDHVVANVIFVDGGTRADDKPTSSALTSLPIEISCNVSLKFKDNNGNVLDFTNSKNNSFIIKKITPITDDATKGSVSLELITTEAVKNEKSGVDIRTDGKISDHVKKIFQDKKYLASKKTLDIEETSNNLNYCMNKNKLYFQLNTISRDGIPSGQSNPQASANGGSSAGFIFYETYDGLKFKSIDGLLGQKQKLSIIYNNTPGSNDKDIPAGYDVKALTYSKDNVADLTKKQRMGAWDTKLSTFDLYSFTWEESEFNAEDSQQYLKLAGKSFPKLNEELNKEGEYWNATRGTFMVLSPGNLVEGSGLGASQEQLTKSKEKNFEAKKILNQSIMRYNQLFTSKVNITIPGDFSLRAGDAVWFDSVDVKESKNKACGDDVNKESGGKYIIASLCHYLTPKETYTKLSLIRDSVGRDVSSGNHVNR